MKLAYHPDTDSLYIDLREAPASDSEEVAEGVVIDLDERGDIVGIDIQDASRRLDLGVLDSENLPLTSVAGPITS